MSTVFGIPRWQIALGVIAVLAGGYAINTLSRPGLSEAEIQALSETLLEPELLGPDDKGSLVCDLYATEIAYLSECERMFSGGAEGPCPARAAPKHVAVPTAIDGLSDRISDLERLVDQDCNAPLSELMLRISKDPIR